LALAAGVAAFVLAAILCAAARDHVPTILLGLLLLVAVLAVARLAGILYALPVGVVTVQAFDWYFLPPLRELDAATVFMLGLFLVMSVIVGAVTTQAGRRAVASDQARGVLADEQAALRRLATLVARGGKPGEAFAAVAQEIGQVLAAEVACVLRYEANGTATVVAAWGDARSWPIGSNWPSEGESVTARVLRTRRAARMDSYREASGAIAALARGLGRTSGVGAPIIIDDRLWGLVVVNLPAGCPVPPAVEERIANFTDLVATAISNAETRAELIASRARVVASADETRRRLERDLHDGIQQRLVSLALKARVAQRSTPQLSDEVHGELSLIADGLNTALDELREISRGIHPAILSAAGLGPALKALARRSPVPIGLDLNFSRPEAPIEAAAYYVVTEAVTNTAKHAQASVVEVCVRGHSDELTITIHDDGIGGADPSRGSGIIGLKDRVEALGGRISVVSPSGGGTDIYVRLPTMPSAVIPAPAAPGS
jgi:signal transduction histidine kinase